MPKQWPTATINPLSKKRTPSSWKGSPMWLPFLFVGSSELSNRNSKFSIFSINVTQQNKEKDHGSNAQQKTREDDDNNENSRRCMGDGSPIHGGRMCSTFKQA